MKQTIKYSFMLVAALGMSVFFKSCSDDNKTATTDGIDAAQTAILSNYVNSVVVPTYKSLADYAIKLADDCTDLSTQAKVNQACANWIEARKYWELSEAFLFGAAADYSIDPHIDSWPLDLTQLSAVLSAGDIESRIESGTAGYGLLGFHAIEYVIFKEGSTGDANNRNRDVATITEAEARFAAAVAADMRNQCVLLEAAWAGIDNISSAKQAILKDADLSPSFNYGELIVNAGLAGNSRYKTQAAAFEEILVGASNIANEVGNTKISDPMNSHQWSDVESPHSWNSVTDFVDNIRSIRNAYYGTLDGTRSSKSVSAFVASIDQQSDKQVQEKIEHAISTVDAMPRPFRSYIYKDTDAASKAKIQASIDACNSLVDAINKAQEAVKK